MHIENTCEGAYAPCNSAFISLLQPSQGAEDQPTASADTDQAVNSGDSSSSSSSGEDLAAKGAEIKQSLKQLQVSSH